MVAAAGAKSRPINYKALNEENLAAVIQLLLFPAAKKAAEIIATKMRSENGVKRAVESFHANLPFAGLTCDLLLQESTTWIYSSKAGKKSEQQPKEEKKKKSKKSKVSLRLSARAVTVLTEHDQIDLKQLKL